MHIEAIKKLMLNHLDMRPDKIRYIITHETLINGLWGTLLRYCVEHTEETHNLLVEIVQDKLEGPDMEREWSELEYKTFVKFKS